MNLRQAKLYRYWSGLRPPDGGLPMRERFDPLDVPDLLSMLVMATVESAPRRIFFRLVGSDMSEAWGSNFSGKYLDEVMDGSYGAYIQSLFDACIDGAEPIYSRSRFQFDKDRAVDTERLMTPFAVETAPDTVSHVLVGQCFNFNKAGPEKPILVRGQALEEALVS